MTQAQADSFLFASDNIVFRNGPASQATVLFNPLTLTTPSTILGGKGDDNLSSGGGAGGDFLNGNLGNDTVTATGTGASSLIGEEGDDSLTNSGSGADSLDGGNGNDTLIGGTGADTIDAGAG